MRPFPFRSPAALGVLLTSLALPACELHAATPTVQELASMPLDRLLDMDITGASRRPQRMSEAPGAVTVITAEEIHALGYRNIADALRSVRGLSVVYDRSYTFLGVRGFYAPGDYNTRVLLLVDGNRANENLYEQAYLGSEAPLDIDQVERIEFIPGQGSAVYGANALLGVVNVVMRPAAASPSRATLLLGSDGDREWRATVRLGGGGGDAAWLLAASRRVVRGGDVLLPDTQGGLIGPLRGIDHEAQSRLRLAGQGASWRVSLLHVDRDKGIGAPVYTIPSDARSANRDVQTLADASWQHTFDTKTDVQARLFAGHYRFVGTYAIDYPPPTLNRDDDDGRWWGVEARVITRAFAGHVLQVGAELQRSTRIEFRNFDLDEARTTYLDSRAQDHRAGLYAEDHIELGGGFSATLGLRADRQQGRAVEVHPRLALIWRAGDSWVTKLVHGSAFRPPNAFERDYEVAGHGGYQRNPALRMEKVRGSELVAEWTPRPAWRVVMSAYHTQARELIVLDALPGDSGQYVFRNLGAQTLRGLEGELQWRGDGGLMLRANVSLQAPSGGDAFTGQSPRRMAKLTAIVPLPADWTLGLDAQAVSRRGAAAGYAVLNATLSHRLPWRGAEFALTVNDLANRRYADPGTLPEHQPLVMQDGRRAHLRFTLAF